MLSLYLLLLHLQRDRRGRLQAGEADKLTTSNFRRNRSHFLESAAGFVFGDR